MKLKSLDDFDLAEKRVVIREDLNVPLDDGRIRNDERIQAALPTIKQCLQRNAAVIVLSHLGRPIEGEFDPKFSLQPVADALSRALSQTVPLISDWYDGTDVAPGQAVLLENVRFARGEKSNDQSLARRFAELGDIFVMDAFATAHREHASTAGAIELALDACAGPLLTAEIDALTKAMADPARPLVAVIGGAKVSGKLEVLENLASVADTIIVGGGMANTFLSASVDVGSSLCEPELVPHARRIMSRCDVPLPTDVVTSESISASSRALLRQIGEIPQNEMIVDVGPVSARRCASIIKEAGTLIWNGPMGVFEHDQFGEGTRVIGEAIADSSAYSLAGGGDTIAAIAHNDLRDGIDYISTAGGAFLEYLAGRELPAIAALKRKAQASSTS